MKERDGWADSLRAVCMLWIICVAHMDEYLGCDWSSFPILLITRAILATFTFLSGYYMSKKDLSDLSKIMEFYCDRYRKIYIPYLISCCLMFLLHYLIDLKCISSWRQFIKALLGISMLLGNPPSTIWYVLMLVIFYLITPLLLRQRSKYIAGILFWLGIYLLSVFASRVDDRLALYYPSYFLGLIFPKKWMESIQRDKFVSIVVMMIGSVGFCVFATAYDFKQRYFVFVIMTLFFVIFMLGIGTVMDRFVLLRKTLSLLSYGGFFAYLFHRQFFGVIYYHIGNFSFGIAYGIALPMLIIVGYSLQKVYNIYIEKSARKINA